jgi:hypothetical protein
MAYMELCCLANSRKLSGRCVAGIDFVGKRWVRLVSREKTRELKYWHYQLPAPYLHTRVLDLLKVEVHRACPECHHPEDHLIAGSKWQLVKRPARADLLILREKLRPYLCQQPYLFGTPEDRLPFADIQKTAAPASLAVIRVDNLCWRIYEKDGNRRNRARFVYHDTTYDLSVTDPIWEEKLAALPVGIHRPEKTGIAPGAEIWIVSSLGEPYQGDCYKLAATVIAWP